MTRANVKKNKKITAQESKQRIAFPIRLFDEDASGDVIIPNEIHVIPTGEWEHAFFGTMKIGEDEIAEFVKNFNAGVRKEIRITAGHESFQELPAIAWFKELVDRGKEGLFALVEWTEEGKELLQQRSFRYFSPEYFPVYEDPATQRTYRNVLSGGALTNNPFFKELKDVVSFSEPMIINQFTEQHMNLKDILQKSPEELSDEEKTFLTEHKEELNDEQKDKFVDALGDRSDDGGDGDDGGGEGGDAGTDGGDDGAGDGDEGDEGDEGSDEGSDDGAGAQANASEPAMVNGKVVMSEAQYKVLSDKADKGHQAFTALHKMQVASEVDKLTLSETNAAGRFLPKQKGAVQKFMLALSDTQRDQFANIVNNMPKAAVFNDETGDGGDTESEAGKEVDTKAKAKVEASEGKLTYSEAVKQVFEENAELEKRYTEDLGVDI